ncbi:DUF6716 putative glycosyltransferase [Cyanobium sp. NIES-981]|uniref:DUF6716 putative glycosyltransferase n=1 Tax=Cyanobium sp. NIES-981 TaxID=1851505 RepID=UPI0007DE0B52|nr:DUF6716 putative glycosyltransferase [Cyanobium sp. NIES-981]SBO44577.1 conserved protein of unknown function [Cyanobium sp. NIES-981]
MTRLEGRRIAAIASFDSFGKTAMTILSQCRREQARTTLYLLEVQGRRLSRRQLLEIQRIDARVTIVRQEWQALRQIRSSLADLDALVLGLDGQRTRELELLLRADVQPGGWPLTISAYPGILFRHQIEGMMDRSGVDLLCLNSPVDLDLYVQACRALGLNSDNAVVTGLPILWNLHPGRRGRGDQPTIVFFEQPSVPANPLQRHYICNRLNDLAKRWPDHTVIFKPRTSGVERTLHRRHGEMASRIEKLMRKSPNLQINYKPSLALLRQCGCAITVSSTAAMESMAMGISTRIVADLGVNETLGNHYFMGSNTVRSFEAIIDDPFTPIHDESWLDSHGRCQDGSARFIEALVERLERGRVPSAAVAGLTPGPPGWGTEPWQRYALRHGGRRMLTSAGNRSRLKTTHRGKNVVRYLRDLLLGLRWVENFVRGR